MIPKHQGLEGFVWFFGVVEDIDDPHQLGRARVRVIGTHSLDPNTLPTDELPWAHVVLPVTATALQGVGIAPVGLAVGSHVFGFFRDANAKQMPIVLGVVPGIEGGDVSRHDVSGQARGKDLRKRVVEGPEPQTPFRSQYPHNRTITTENGHIIELDDTPGNERISVQHKSGSYVEMNAAGDLVSKEFNNKYDITVKDQTMYVKGDLTITCLGNVNLTAKNVNITETE